MTRSRWVRGARAGLFYGLATAMAQVVDTAVFRRSLYDSHGVAGLSASFTSLVLGAGCAAVIVSVAAYGWNRTHRRCRDGSAGAGDRQYAPAVPCPPSGLSRTGTRR